MVRPSNMRRLYMAFLRGMSANLLSRTGVFLTTSSFLLFILFQFSIVTGWVNNAYIGLISYMALPSLFVFGLLLIPLGWWRYIKVRKRPFFDLFAGHFTDEDLRARSQGARVYRFFALLTMFNIVFLGMAGTSTVKYMEDPHFCGTACHTVMDPEWTTYQQSPHASVKCVQCHVGEGVDALIDSKLNGAWQLVAASFDLYDRPIATPVHDLRPARETCEHCHWPAKFHGDAVRTFTSYEQDEKSSPRYTALLMKIGSGGEGEPTGSHWHVAPENSVRYTSVDDERKTMIWVEIMEKDGSWTRFRNTELGADAASDKPDQELRTMDCVDCHNRATHIYEDPEAAVDSRIARGEIDISLPFVKKRALDALLADYQGKDKATAISEIGETLERSYKKDYPELFPNKNEALEKSVAAIQGIYSRNIHPKMNIVWGAYPSFLGHQDDSGCFRCHNGNLKTEQGEEIPTDCGLCHSIIALQDDVKPDFLEF